jgi:gamma-glutamylputrescine oxidase
MDLLTENDAPNVYPPSFYAAEVGEQAPRAKADGGIDCDVCVIGGGYAGLSSALHCSQKGYSVALLEANRVGWGASGRNGGQVNLGQRVDQITLEKMLGPTQALLMWNLCKDASALVRYLVEEHAIDCHYTSGSIFAAHRKRFVKSSHAYAEKLRKDYSYDLIEPLNKDQIQDYIGSKAYLGGTLNRGSGHLQPLAFALGLARAAENSGAKIYENSRVIRIDAGARPLVSTADARVSCQRIIIACNGYHNDLFPAIAKHVIPVNNFIVATEPLSEDLAQSVLRGGVCVFDSRFIINYFRLTPDRRMLFGGGRTYRLKFPRDIAARVRKPMLETFPQLKDARIDFAWGGTLGITRNRLPYFEGSNANVLMAAGFSGHGVAIATLAGAVLADAMSGDRSRFDVFEATPSPAFPRGALLRTPLLMLAAIWFSIRDRL